VSNDPLQHHPDAPGFRMGSIYTMSEDDYNKVTAFAPVSRIYDY
jgi:hypothetical protein